MTALRFSLWYFLMDKSYKSIILCCSAWTNKLITAKDHASVQINIGHLDANGVYSNQYTTFAIAGNVRAMVSEGRDGRLLRGGDPSSSPQPLVAVFRFLKRYVAFILEPDGLVRAPRRTEAHMMRCPVLH